MSRFQHGSIRKEDRKKGAVWVYRYYATRDYDGKRVERTLTIGAAKRFPTESSAWAEIERRRMRERMSARWRSRVLQMFRPQRSATRDNAFTCTAYALTSRPVFTNPIAMMVEWRQQAKSCFQNSRVWIRGLAIWHEGRTTSASLFEGVVDQKGTSELPIIQALPVDNGCQRRSCYRCSTADDHNWYLKARLARKRLLNHAIHLIPSK